MVSSTPAGNGFPIGLMPGALPSDHASRQTLNTTAIFLPPGHTQFTCCLILRFAPLAAGRGGGTVISGFTAGSRTAFATHAALASTGSPHERSDMRELPRQRNVSNIVP